MLKPEVHTIEADFKRTEDMLPREEWFSSEDKNSDLKIKVFKNVGGASISVSVQGHDHIEPGDFILSVDELVQRFVNLADGDQAI